MLWDARARAFPEVTQIAEHVIPSLSRPLLDLSSNPYLAAQVGHAPACSWPVSASIRSACLLRPLTAENGHLKTGLRYILSGVDHSVVGEDGGSPGTWLLFFYHYYLTLRLNCAFRTPLC